MRGFLNAGHRHGAVAGRCVVRGRKIETEEIPAYCAVALAGIGDLPDTILSRSIVVRMRRRAPHERVKAFRRRMYEREGTALRERLEIWAAENLDRLSSDIPEMPGGVDDRDADVWESLIAIADLAAGGWPDRARTAAVTLVAAAKESSPSLGVRLLSDLRRVFGQAEALSTGAIIQALCTLDEAPWGDIRGKPLDDRGLAARLRKYDVSPKVIRMGEGTCRGYIRADFLDAWSRYVRL
jgi:hypothetical protein